MAAETKSSSSSSAATAAADYTDDNLFFGTVPVTFAPAEGKAYRYRAENFTETDAKETKDLARARLQPVAFLGAGYESMIVPAIPATDLVVTKDPDVSTFPELLRTPLLKGTVGKIQGIASGVRSAILKVGEKWYRLKGCGNNAEGFTFATISPKSPLINIRGSSFEHTTHRELFMTALVNELLEKEGLKGANLSVGWYEYSMKLPLPKIIRTCVVCECLGERRLGDHLLNGVERILPLLLPSLPASTVLPLLGENRQPTDMGHATWLASTILEDVKFNDIFGNVAFREQAPDAAALPAGVSPRWRSLWAANARTLATALTAVLPAATSGGRPVGSLLAYLHWRIGRETGLIIRILQDNRISWGTYTDAMGTHCNAHTNNLVLRLESSPDAPFLAPLDLDMAFTEKSHLWETKEGKRDDAEFKKWMNMELSMFKMALAGDEDASTGIKARSALTETYAAYKWLLRDTLMSGFQSGFERRTDEHPLVPALTPAVYALLRLALITTADDIA